MSRLSALLPILPWVEQSHDFPRGLLSMGDDSHLCGSRLPVLVWLLWLLLSNVGDNEGGSIKCSST